MQEACHGQHSNSLHNPAFSRCTDWSTNFIWNKIACDWPALILYFLSLENLTWQSQHFSCAITYKCTGRLGREYLERDMDVFMLLKLTVQTPCDVSRQVPSSYRKGCGLIKQLEVNTWCLSCAQLVFLVLKGHTGSSPVLEVPGVQKLLSCCLRAEVLLPVKGRWDVLPFPCGGEAVVPLHQKSQFVGPEKPLLLVGILSWVMKIWLIVGSKWRSSPKAFGS